MVSLSCGFICETRKAIDQFKVNCSPFWPNILSSGGVRKWMSSAADLLALPRVITVRVRVWYFCFLISLLRWKDFVRMSREACSGFCLESLSLGVDSLFAQRVLAGIDRVCSWSFHICFSSRGLFTSSFLSMLGFWAKKTKRKLCVYYIRQLSK